MIMFMNVTYIFIFPFMLRHTVCDWEGTADVAIHIQINKEQEYQACLRKAVQTKSCLVWLYIEQTSGSIFFLSYFCLWSTFDLTPFQIYDGKDNAAHMLGAFTGSSMLGLTLISTSNHLWLEFYSDAEATGEGFKLVYSSKLLHCPYTLHTLLHTGLTLVIKKWYSHQIRCPSL